MTYVPLGGDGLVAPFAAYTMKTMLVTGDASAGSASLNINMDPRFCSLVSYATIAIQQGTSADADVDLFVRGNTSGSVVFRNLVTAVASLVTASEIGLTWQPPPVMIPGGGEGASLEANFKNVDGDVFIIDALIYLFNIRVRELTPMGPLLWARGST